MKKLIPLLTTLLLHLAVGRFAQAQGPAFTYQGRLNVGASPASGLYDFRFELYDASGGGARQGGTLTNSATAVTTGLFTVTLDFGNQFPGADRWLEIGVRSTGGGAFSTLTPRQALATAPYSVYSVNAGVATSASAVLAANIVGTLAAAQLPANLVSDGASGVNLTGTFSGSGAGLTGVNLMYANSYGAFQLTTNYDGGNFVLIGSPVVDSHPQSITAADVNGDGRGDLICANAGTNTLSVLTNNGNGSFTLAATLGVGVGPYSVTTADVNNDAQVDLISANFGNSLSVLTNNGTGERPTINRWTSE